ncbi:hypothetical protein WCU37_08755 [Serratia marcescens]|uniref:hypothetical protein n=1 Tax=Serratia marcescens TaxID=615 RepID=UPI0030D32FBB
MTLTTEQLRARIAHYRELAYRYGISGNPKHEAQYRDDAAFLEELLANREAQPVAWRYRYRRGPHKGTWIYVANESECATRPFHEKQEIYTAPPAPANAQAVAWEMRYWNSGHGCWHDWERITAEQHAEMSVQHVADNDYEFRVLYDAPPAPAVVEVLEDLLSIVRSSRALPRRKEWVSGQQYSYVLLENVEAMIEDACRAAMLAQPVSQSYKLPVELHNYDGGCVVFGAADDANEAPEGGK